MKTSLPAIFLLCILSAPTLSLYSWLQTKKLVARREVQQMLEVGLPESKLTTLVFSVRDAEHHLRWEHENEFEYQGQMYDIAERELRGDSIVFKVWPDHAETALNRSLAKLVSGVPEHPGKSPSSTELINRFFKLMYLPGWLPAIIIAPATDAFLIAANDHLPTGKSLVPPTPPPRFC